MNKKLYEFLKGRNGADDLTKLALYSSLFLMILGFFIDNEIITIASFFLIVYANFRVFSRNLDARIKENFAYIKKRNEIKRYFVKLKNRIFGKDGYKYFECKSCKKELRVPKKRGKLKVKCPSCQNVMEIRS